MFADDEQSNQFCADQHCNSYVQASMKSLVTGGGAQKS
jgi:hypothetical protein